MAQAATLAAALIAQQQAAAARAAAIATANRAWQPYAAARGFHFGIGRAGWGHESMPRLQGVIDGIPVALELVANLYTAVLATPRFPLNGHVGITRTDTVSKLAGLFGAQDVQVGSDAFDKMYVVKATDPALAKRLMDPTTQTEMMAMNAWSFSYDDGAHDEHHPIVAMYIRAIPQKPEDIERVFRLVVAAASAHPESAPYR